MYGALEAAKRNGITEFILASSSEAYQTSPVVPTPEDVPLTIPDPWNPRYSYGGSKLISEIMLANYHRDLFEKAINFGPITSTARIWVGSTLSRNSCFAPASRSKNIRPGRCPSRFRVMEVRRAPLCI